MVQILPHNNSSLTQNVAVDLSVIYLNLFSFCFVLMFIIFFTRVSWYQIDPKYTNVITFNKNHLSKKCLLCGKHD